MNLKGNITTEERHRRSRGVNGAYSKMIITRLDGDVISVRHVVNQSDGTIIHQHTVYIGKAGSTREFSDEWTGEKTIPPQPENQKGKPHENDKPPRN